MTQEEIDIMWQQAMQESIKDCEMFTRYQFAKFVEDKALAEHAMQEVQRLGQEIEQEPVCPDCKAKVLYECVACSCNNYPPQRKPLTDERMKKIWYAMQNIMGWYSFQEIARAIEAAHGIQVSTPPQRTWVGLTDEEIETIADKVANENFVGVVPNFRVRFARSIEQALKEKST